MSDENQDEGPDDIKIKLAFVSSIIYYMSPMIRIFQISCKRIDAKYVTYLPIYFMILTTCIYFTRSFLDENGYTGSMCNCAGFCVCIVWFLGALKVKFPDNQVNFWKYIIIFLGAVIILIIIESILVYAVGKDPGNIWDSIFQNIGIAPNVLMYISCDWNIIHVFKSYEYQYIQIENCIIGTINAVFWMVWALNEDDKMHTVISNAVSIAITVAQIIIFFYARSVFKRRNIKMNGGPLVDEQEDEPVEKRNLIEGEGEKGRPSHKEEDDAEGTNEE